MKISTRKRLDWVVFFLGAGGVCIFLTIFIIIANYITIMGWFSQIPIFFMISLVLAIIAACDLRYCYKKEPSRQPGYWHLSLTDLLTMSIFAGLIMALCRGIWTEGFLTAGVPTTFGSVFLLTIGFLCASRRKIRLWRMRSVYALSYGMWLYGLLGAGALIMAMIFVACDGRYPFEVITEVFFSSLKGTLGEKWFMMMLRLSLPSLLLGHIVCRAIEKRIKPDDASATPANPKQN